MAIKGLFTLTDRLLERALDGVSQRQRVTSHNIANANTPGFKRQRVSFEKELRHAVQRPRADVKLQRTHPRHISHAAPNRVLIDRPFLVERDPTTVMRNDGNNVDIEAEMAQLTKDQILYHALVQQASKRYAMLKDAVTEGRR